MSNVEVKSGTGPRQRTACTSATNAWAAARAAVRLVCWARVDDALPLVVFNRWLVVASERETQARGAFVSVCSPERTFFALKFGEFLVGSAREMFARRLSNPCRHNSPPGKQPRYGNKVQ
jgi:hypothetical protein